VVNLLQKWEIITEKAIAVGFIWTAAKMLINTSNDLKIP
tara:strand:- start:2229 stop:2345 length:117 start_codon:yes stop_codon:yes gene_type:complete